MLHMFLSFTAVQINPFRLSPSHSATDGQSTRLGVKLSGRSALADGPKHLLHLCLNTLSAAIFHVPCSKTDHSTYSSHRSIVSYNNIHISGGLRGRDNSGGTATGHGLDGPGIESRWGEIFRTRPDGPWGPLSLLYNGYRLSLLGGKAAGVWRCHPLPSSAEVKEIVEVYPYSPSGPSWPVLGWALSLRFCVVVLHVSAFFGHLQGGSGQRKIQLLLMSQMCISKPQETKVM